MSNESIIAVPGDVTNPMELRRFLTKLVEAIVQEETKNAIQRMPISFQVLAALFDHLDEVFGNEGCDHTLKITKGFLEARNLNVENILPWLGEYGGYCDCEVLANLNSYNKCNS